MISPRYTPGGSLSKRLCTLLTALLLVLSFVLVVPEANAASYKSVYAYTGDAGSLVLECPICYNNVVTRYTPQASGTHQVWEGDTHEYMCIGHTHGTRNCSDKGNSVTITGASVKTITISGSPDGICDYCGQTIPIDPSTCSHTTVSYTYSYADASLHSKTTICSACGTSMGQVTESHSLATKKYDTSYHGQYCSECATWMSKSTSHTFITKYYSASYHGEYCSACGYWKSKSTAHTTTTKYKNTSTHGQYCSGCSSWISTTSHSTTTSYSPNDGESHAVREYCSGCSSTISTTTASHADSNSDGKCDACSYSLSVFSVVVPTSLQLVLSSDGTVTTSPITIVNNSTVPVSITDIQVSALGDWTLKDYTFDVARSKVDSKYVAVEFGDYTPAITAGSTFDLTWSAKISACSAAMQNEPVLTIILTIT